MKVLIAEADDIVADVCHMFLDDIKVENSICNTIEGMLDAYKSNKPDVVAVCLRLPTKNEAERRCHILGKGVRVLRAVNSDAKVLIITGGLDYKSFDNGDKNIAILEKPFSAKALAASLTRLTGEKL